jgi:hypothetical protein
MNLGNAFRQTGYVNELMPRLAPLTQAGAMFSNGCSANALSANTITLTATTTPILGVWNPSNSGVNAVTVQAALQTIITSATAVGQGTYVWASSTGNTSATPPGVAPFNRATMGSTGSAVKGLSFQALTNLTNNLVIFEGADFGGLSFTITANGSAGNAGEGTQNFDGSLIVPPGGVLALLNTTSTTTVSVAGRLLWAEVPLA